MQNKKYNIYLIFIILISITTSFSSCIIIMKGAEGIRDLGKKNKEQEIPQKL